jgi:hypothetical protein
MMLALICLPSNVVWLLVRGIVLLAKLIGKIVLQDRVFSMGIDIARLVLLTDASQTSHADYCYQKCHKTCDTE